MGKDKKFAAWLVEKLKESSRNVRGRLKDQDQIAQQMPSHPIHIYITI
jgi:hypothetical protein